MAPYSSRDEAGRLDALRRYPRTAPDRSLDDLTALTAHVCRCPMAVVALVDADRPDYISTVGLTAEAPPSAVAFSSWVIAERDVVVVPDAAADPRFARNPLVTGAPRVRFFAGAPLLTPDDHAIGALAVMAPAPTRLDAADERALRVLSQQVMAQLELRRQAHELLDGEHRLRVVTEDARVGLVMVNPDRRYVFANATYAEIFGLSGSTLVGQRVRDALPDVYDSQISPRLDRAFAGERVAYELRRAVPGGDRFYSVRYEPTVIADRVPLVVVVITETTELRQAESDSRRLAAIVKSSADAIVGKDLDGIVTSWNTGAERLFGYTAAEMIGTSILRIIPADRHEEERRIIGEIRRGASIQSLETKRQTRDGRLIDVSVTASPIRDEHGAVIGASKVARDITERHEAVAALAAAEGRMRFALESADVGIWEMDYLTGVLQWSDTIEKHFGLRAGTFGGTFQAYVDRVHPDDRGALLEAIGRAMASGDDFSVQHRAVWPDGTVRWIAGAGRILVDDAGAPVRGIGITLDVTKHRSLEAQYHQAQKMEAVGRLAAGVAHDFNNLLTAILGYCELLLAARGADDQDRRDIVEIQKAGLRAASLTRQLLAFSRKQIVEPTLLDLNAVVLDMRQLLDRLIGEDVRIEVTPSRVAAAAKADRGQLEQVVLNLAVNARDAMPHGGTLTIETDVVELDEQYARTHLHVAPGRYVALTVADTGTGMTAEVQERLFEPFFTTKEAGKGTGLGMATVHGIVTAAGGSIGVYSEVGYGTSVTVYLPVAEGAGADLQPAAAAPSGGAETVLVVEDSDGLRELARRLLVRQGYSVLLAANADEAMRLFDSEPSIDVLLTDVVMPGASGPELTKSLVERRPTLKVVYMSGYTEDAISHHGVMKAGVAFLHKPFTSDSLARKIREVLDKS